MATAPTPGPSRIDRGGRRRAGAPHPAIDTAVDTAFETAFAAAESNLIAAGFRFTVAGAVPSDGPHRDCSCPAAAA